MEWVQPNLGIIKVNPLNREENREPGNGITFLKKANSLKECQFGWKVTKSLP